MTEEKYTRCPECRTVYRVTDEQLAQRNGRVRCGHCQVVFDGVAELVAPVAPEAFAGREDAPSEQPASEFPRPEAPIPAHERADWQGMSSPEPQPEDVQRTDQASHGALWQAEAQAPWPHAEVSQGEAPVGGPLPGEPSPPASPLSESPAPQPALVEAQFPPTASEETALRDESAEAGSTELGATDEATPVAGAAPDAGTPEPTDTAAPEPTGTAPHPEPSAAPAATEAGARTSPSMAAAAEATRAAAPADRGARTFFAAAAVLLALLLPIQAVFHFREAIAARWPAASPLIHQACRAVGCTVGAPREVTDLAIQASDLQADPAHQGLLILTATIRNRGAVPLAYPYVELTLTDAQDQVVVRRALTPAEYVGGTIDLTRGIPANSDVAIKLFIDASATTQAGYRLFLFYG